MSTKKKTTSKKPKSSVPTGKRYDLDLILGPRTMGRYGGVGDELDQVLRDARKMQADKIKSMQVEKIGLEIQKDLGRLRKEVDAGIGGVTGVSPQELADVTQVISQLPEEQRPIAIQALSAFRQQSGTPMGTMAPMLMLSMLQQKPQTDITQLVGALKGLNDIQQGSKPNWGGMDSVFTVAKMLGDAKDTAYQTQMQMMRKELEDVKPYDPVAYTKSLMDVATGLGFKPGTGEVNVELEKIKMEHTNMLQKSSQEFQLLLKKMDRDDNRMESLITVLQRPLEALAVAGSSRMTGARAGGVQQVSCPQPECGYSPIWISDDAPALCPQCGVQVVTEAYQQKLLAKQQAEAQQPQEQQPNPQEERRPPARGHVQV